MSIEAMQISVSEELILIKDQKKWENGNTIKHSVGVSTFEGKFEVKEGIRYVKEWRLWEVSSLTKWPANDNTPTHAVKNFDIQNYYDWMCKEGMHTDDFIKQVEQLLHNIKESQEALEKKKEPSEDTQLIESILKLKVQRWKIKKF